MDRPDDWPYPDFDPVATGDERATLSDATDLDVTGLEHWRGPLSLRWVLVHMIEEYAQHNGHADLLRERIDGQVTTDPMDVDAS